MKSRSRSRGRSRSRRDAITRGSVTRTRSGKARGLSPGLPLRRRTPSRKSPMVVSKESSDRSVNKKVAKGGNALKSAVTKLIDFSKLPAPTYRMLPRPKGPAPPLSPLQGPNPDPYASALQGLIKAPPSPEIPAPVIRPKQVVWNKAQKKNSFPSPSPRAALFFRAAVSRDSYA